MAQIGDINLQEPSTVTARLAAVQITRNSTVQSQEVLVLGSPNSTTALALAEVMGSAPASTTVGLVTRPIGPLTVAQSTAADLNVTAAQSGTWDIGTVTAVSSVAGQVTVRPASTGWASSAGFNFDSSGALQVTGATASTGVTVNRLVGNSSAADYVPVRLVNSSGDGFVGPSVDYSHGSTLSTGLTAPGVLLRASAAVPAAVAGDDRWVAQWATLNGAANVVLVTSSGVSAMDSTESALKVNVVAGAAGGSTLVTIRQSTYTDLLGLMRLGDRDASTATAAVLNATPASTAYGLAVREVAAPSTGPFVMSSLGGRVLVDQNSTVWPVQVSSVAGVVTVSTGPTLARLVNSSGELAVLSTGSPAVGAHALAVREGLGTLQSTTTFLTSSNSTAVYALVSSVAGVRHKVFAIAVMSTHTTPSTLVFMSSNAIDRWAVGFGSGSSGVTGANLAVSPPAWLFHADAANALNCRIENVSTQVLVRVSLSWFDEA